MKTLIKFLGTPLFGWLVNRLTRVENKVDALSSSLPSIQDMKQLGARIDEIQKNSLKITEITELIDSQKHTELLENIYNQTNRLLLTRYRVSYSKIRVVFLVHVPEFWYALKPIYDRMLEDSNFQPLIVTLPGDLLGVKYINLAAAYFARQCISTIDIHEPESIDKCLFEKLNPDVVFKQVPWEGQYPDYFKTINILGYRVCYIPYGIHTNPIDELLYNDHIHNFAWRLYCVNDSHQEKYAVYNSIKDINTVVSGYTKFEYINHEMKNNSLKEWPISSAISTKLKIIWAPHHSVDGWLGFCTFHNNFNQIITYIEQHPEIQMVFRPHPALYEVMLNSNKMTEAQINEFNDKLTSLDNCYLDAEADYIHLFKHADVLITDGVGFLFEFLLTGKPIIHIDSQVNCGFNDYYKQIEPAWYKAYQFSDVEQHIGQLLSALDPLEPVRKELVKLLYPINDREPSEIICADLKNLILGK